jgi:hypothetical protein
MRIVLGLVFLSTAFFQNCSQFQSEMNFSSRQNVVSSKVFLPAAVVDEGAMGTVLANGGTDASGTATQLNDCLALGECESNGTIYVMNPKRTVDLPIKYYCSNNWTSLAGNTNTRVATGLKMAFVSSTGAIACEVSSADFKTAVMNEKHLKATIPAGDCPNFVSGRYTVLVIAANQTFNTSTSTSITQRSMIIGNNDHDHPVPLVVDATMDAQGYMSVKPVLGTTPFLLYKENVKGQNTQCEQVNSPLVVQLTIRPRKVRLTAPAEGVKFDILGENDSPAHSLHQISWFNSNDAFSHYFIALPDSNGDVKGINELFGNNTRGPDGAFAPNGYAALAKWDGRRSDGSIDRSAQDGVIDKKDEVFWNLRFWADRNQNGIAETSELFRIEEVGLVSIDLNFDANYAETDRGGNEIKMKSTVQSTTGQLYLMYDIWYRRVD